MTPQQSTARPSEVVKAKSQSTSWPISAVFVLIAAVTFLAYLPALSGDFLWDDAGHVTSYALQSWSGLGRIWFEIGATQQYYPLLHSAFWIEHCVWGDASVGYHLVNILWHVISACLLVSLLRRLGIPGAVLVGIVFALHPVCVESVAWISEQKNTLSTVFYLASAIAWLKFEDQRLPKRYVVAIVWFIAALLTKSVTATLPMAILVIAWWRRGRISWQHDLLPLFPWFVLGLGAGLTTAWFESTQIGVKSAEFNISFLSHILLACRVVWFYASKLVWPANLIFFYPHWTIDTSSLWQWLFIVATVITLTALIWWQKRNRSPLAAILLFCGTLFPVLGFVKVYPFIFSYVADHFQYLASLAMVSFIGASAWHGFTLLRWPRWTGLGLAAILTAILGMLTWQQCGMYRDVRTLYTTTLERNPESWVANLNLGIVLDETGETEKSLSYLKRALELKPAFPETLNSLGNVLNRLGRSSEALPLLNQAIRLEPRFAAAYNSLGATFMNLDRVNDGTLAFRQAVELDPKWTLARLNLGWALANSGHTSDAVAQFRQVLTLQPELAEAEAKWGLTLVIEGNNNEALDHIKRAVYLQPEDPELRYNLGQIFLHTGQKSKAVEQFEETLRIDPNHSGAKEALLELRRARTAVP
jgi:tetratricopeptide (TPR) repeat protein